MVVAAPEVIQAGAAKAKPYTILFVCNPVLKTAAGGWQPDPLTKSQARFRNAVAVAVRSIFGDFASQAERFMSGPDIRPHVRVVRVGVTQISANDLDSDNALLEESTLMGGSVVPRRKTIHAWTLAHAERADVVFVVSKSRCTRSSAWGTTADQTKGGTPFTLDGVAQTHWHHAKIPGTVALHLSDAQSGSMVPAHEFGHAASCYQSGYVADLYTDPCTPCLNVKLGSHTTATFGTYGTVTYGTDTTRGGLGWNPPYSSYHCERPASSPVPALMDNFNRHGVKCQHDAITLRFLTDHILAKIAR